MAQAKKPNLGNMVNEVVPRLYYEEKEQELLAKEEELQVGMINIDKVN